MGGVIIMLTVMWSNYSWGWDQTSHIHSEWCIELHLLLLLLQVSVQVGHYSLKEWWCGRRATQIVSVILQQWEELYSKKMNDTIDSISQLLYVTNNTGTHIVPTKPMIISNPMFGVVLYRSPTFSSLPISDTLTFI